MNFVPQAEIIEPCEEVSLRAGHAPIVHAHQSPPDIRLRQKREKVAALDMRFKEYRKAEP